MSRRRTTFVVAAGTVILLCAFVLAGVLLFGPDSARPVGTSTTTVDSQRSLSAASTEVQAAPVESGGEPFRLCETCHADFEQRPSATQDLIFSHPVHMQQDIKCETCHNPPLGHFTPPAPMMMTCLGCHDDETAPNDCQNCHRKLDEIAPGLGESSVHVRADARTRATCEKCHDVEVWCEQCHGVVMPHPLSWQRFHGEAGITHSQDCVKCHQSKDKTFCIRCHGVEMPHPAYWYSNHGDIAQANRPACFKCHPGEQEFCDRCHHAGFAPTPDWPDAQHGRVVAERGARPCLVCHEETFCERCHAPGEHTGQ